MPSYARGTLPLRERSGKRYFHVGHPASEVLACASIEFVTFVATGLLIQQSRIPFVHSRILPTQRVEMLCRDCRMICCVSVNRRVKSARKLLFTLCAATTIVQSAVANSMHAQPSKKPTTAASTPPGVIALTA